MTAELEAIVATLEAVHEGIRSHASASAAREWQRRLDAFSRVVEGWLRFAQPHSPGQVVNMLECVVALQAEVRDRSSGTLSVAPAAGRSSLPPRVSSSPGELEGGLSGFPLRHGAR